MVFKTIPFGRSGISPLKLNRPLVHRELCETAKLVVKNGWKNRKKTREFFTARGRGKSPGGPVG